MIKYAFRLRKVIGSIKPFASYINVLNNLEITYNTKSYFSESQTTTADSAESGKNNSESGKWKRFFLEQKVDISIDMDRSLKTQNKRLIENYILRNYMIFSFEDLIKSLIPVQDKPLLINILTELKSRIYNKNYDIPEKTALKMLILSKSGKLLDPPLRKVLCVYLHTHFKTYKHADQVRVLNFFLEQDIIDLSHLKTIKKFAKQELDVIGDYFQNLSLIDQLEHLRLYNTLKKVLSQETFDGLLKQDVIDLLADKILIKLKQLDLLTNEEWSYVTNLDHMVILRQEHLIELKLTLADLFYQRFNFEETAGTSNPNEPLRRNENIFFGGLVSPSDRYFLHKAIVMRIATLITKTSNPEIIINYIHVLHRLKIADPGVLEIFAKTILNLTDRRNQRGQAIDRQTSSFLVRRSKLLTELNYQEVLSKSSDYYDQFLVDKVDDLKFFIQSMMPDTKLEFSLKALSKLKVSLKNATHSQKDIQDINSDEEIAVPEEGGEAKGKTSEGEDEAIPIDKALEELAEGKKPEIVGSHEETNDSKIRDVSHINESLLRRYQSRISKMTFVKVKFYDKKLAPEERAVIVDYITKIDMISKLLQNPSLLTPSLTTTIEKFMKEDAHEEFIKDFCGFPRFLESLISIDIYSNKLIKAGLAGEDSENDKSFFTPTVQTMLRFYKSKIDEFFNSPKKFSEKLLEVKNYLDARVERGDVLEDDIIREQHYVALNSKANDQFESSPDTELYRAFVDQTYDDDAKEAVRFHYVPNIFEKYSIGFDIQEENSKKNFYIMILNSHCFRMAVSPSRIKVFFGNILDQEGIPYIRNHVDYPAIIDYLIYPNTEKQIAVQVRDTSKMLVGAADALLYEAQTNDKILEALGYKVVQIDHTDFSSEKKSIFEKLGISEENRQYKEAPEMKI